MPRPDFLPRREGELDVWARNFSARVSADPDRYSISPAEAAELALRTEDFSAALNRARDPSTRTRPAVAGKDSARRSLAACVRPLARRIQALPQTDDAERIELRLSVAGELRRTVVASGGPVGRPVLYARSLDRRRVALRLGDEQSPGHRGKPRGVVGAVLTARAGTGDGSGRVVGEERYLGIVTRGLRTIELPDVAPPAPGTLAEVWLTARWFDGRGREGPPARPVRAVVIP